MQLSIIKISSNFFNLTSNGIKLDKLRTNFNDRKLQSLLSKSTEPIPKFSCRRTALNLRESSTEFELPPSARVKVLSLPGNSELDY